MDRLNVVLGAVIVDFLLKVTSAAKFAVPPLKVPIISISTPFLNKPAELKGLTGTSDRKDFSVTIDKVG